MVGHFLGELGSGDGLESGIVLDEVRVEDLATDVLGIEEDRLHVGPGRVQACGEAGGAAADDDEVEVGQLTGPFRKALSH
jgi:hypothetical protein